MVPYHRQTTISPTFPNVPDFSLTNVKFADFSRWLATLEGYEMKSFSIQRRYTSSEQIPVDKEHKVANKLVQPPKWCVYVREVVCVCEGSGVCM